MRSSIFLAIFGVFLLSCDRSERRHPLSSLDLKPGNFASVDIFGRVVVGKRNQRVTFQTGVLPIPFVQTEDGVKNLDDLRDLSFSEHAGRASGGYLRARVINISRRNSETQRFDNISLTELDRSRRVRSAIAQFPTPLDFKNRGFRGAAFRDSAETERDLIFYPTDSTEVKIFEAAIGRVLKFPALVTATHLIENYQ